MATAPRRPLMDDRDLKKDRLNLRVSSRQRAVIEEAAGAANKDLSAFVLEAALTDAERVLTDRRSFSLPKREWDTFLRALDRPAAAPPEGSRLRTLLDEPSVLER